MDSPEIQLPISNFGRFLTAEEIQAITAVIAGIHFTAEAIPDELRPLQYAAEALLRHVELCQNQQL